MNITSNLVPTTITNLVNASLTNNIPLTSSQVKINYFLKLKLNLNIIC